MPTRDDMAQTPLRVVGIGASAGGLEAVSRLLARLSPGTGLSFVLVQHLDPERPSQLPEILSRSTTMRGSAAVDGAPLVADEILIAPPHALVGVRAGCLTIRPSPADGSPFLPIDAFFQAIADEFHDGAAGVVLSGTGSDGAAGVTAIRSGGGLAIAQAPASAQFPAMPNAAIEAGVDLVLAPEDIADTLSAFRGIAGDSFRRLAGPEDDLGLVLDTLRTVRGRDFSRYKRGTVERRIRRRMALLKFETLEDYARHLAEDRSEQDALCEDLLIKVTRFFREPEGLDQLKTVVFPRVVQDKGPGEPIRIWVAGCATGEEAFSIAICMSEFLASRHLARTVHIFATDVSKEAIEKARTGHFGTEVEATVSAARREAFFVKSDKGYQIAKSIREMCIFAEQDVTKDPPFSRMDLISCRNLLIYFGDALQRQVLSTFHFALNPSGFLLLGNAESIGQAAELFAATGKGSRLFSRRLVPSRTPDFAFERVTGKASREAPHVFVRKFSPADALKGEADHAIADSFALDGVVIDEHMEILQFRGHTEPFLTHRPGEHASFHLFKMARDGLLVDLRLAIFEAQATNRPVRRDHVRIARTEDATTFEAAIQVLPFRAQSTGQNYFVVLFEKVAGAGGATPAGGSPEGPGAHAADTVTMLQRELAETKQYLNSLIEKEQASNEELKTASEEILSSNEELQSTNEELQTAKQETEATNEELTTVNDELRHRNAELARAHGDLANLVSAAQVSVLILEKDLTCRSLTPDAERLLNLASPAIGRPLDELVAGFRTPDIRKRAEEVLETLSPHEFETQDQAGRWYALRIRPYRTLDNKIDGVALAIRDIDSLKSAALRIEAARDYADIIVATVPVPLLVLDRDRRVAGANPAFLRTFRIEDLQAPIPLDRLAGGDWDIPELRRHVDALASASDPLNDLVLQHDFKSCGRRTLRVSGRRFAGQSPASPMILLAIEDVTDTADAKRQLVSAIERAETANRAKSEFLANMSHEIRTPLTAILGFADLLAARDPAAADPGHPLAKIRRNARQLTELINDILDLSKVEAGRLDVDTAPFSLLPLLAEELATLRDRARDKGLAFEVRFDGPVPETVSSCSTRLRQILLNVVGNAIKFTDSGTVTVTVSLLPATSATGQRLGFVVRDTGCGITPEQQPNLFQVFGQADGSVARRYGGSGLGLNLSRRLAQALGGDVALTDSSPGNGSTFTITIDPGDLRGVRMLSGLDGAMVLTRAEPLARPVATSSGIADGLRVLLAEDNPDNRELISLFLETSGAEVDFAVNGEEAVRMAAERAHDVILMDIQMPVMDGYEATRRIRQSGNGTPIVALTAHAMSGEKDRCRAAGCDDYLSKPIDFASLIDMVARYGGKKDATSGPRSG